MVEIVQRKIETCINFHSSIVAYARPSGMANSNSSIESTKISQAKPDSFDIVRFKQFHKKIIFFDFPVRS